MRGWFVLMLAAVHPHEKNKQTAEILLKSKTVSL